MKYTPFIFVLALMACNSNSSSSRVEYNFPEKTIITSVKEDNCLEGKTGTVVEKGNEIEKGLLDFVSGEVETKTQKEAGEQMHKELSEQYKFIEDERTKKLKALFQKLTPFASRKDIAYNVYLIDSKEINAFTIPGGNVYVTTAIVDFVKSDDELACIIGHEIGHNENKHTNRVLQRKQAVNGVLGDLGGNVFAGLTSLIFMSYGQPQELEADRAGVYLAYSAGYHPEKGTDFFARVDDGAEHGGVERFLTTHPFNKERVSCLKNYLEKCRKK